MKYCVVIGNNHIYTSGIIGKPTKKNAIDTIAFRFPEVRKIKNPIVKILDGYQDVNKYIREIKACRTK